jgi:hypothetical protein
MAGVECQVTPGGAKAKTGKDRSIRSCSRYGYDALNRLRLGFGGLELDAGLSVRWLWEQDGEPIKLDTESARNSHGGKAIYQ